MMKQEGDDDTPHDRGRAKERRAREHCDAAQRADEVVAEGLKGLNGRTAANDLPLARP